ncbi:unnamed protein product, partial [Ixodes persulcatus]
SQKLRPLPPQQLEGRLDVPLGGRGRSRCVFPPLISLRVELAPGVGLLAHHQDVADRTKGRLLLRRVDGWRLVVPVRQGQATERWPHLGRVGPAGGAVLVPPSCVGRVTH